VQKLYIVSSIVLDTMSSILDAVSTIVALLVDRTARQYFSSEVAWLLQNVSSAAA